MRAEELDSLTENELQQKANDCFIQAENTNVNLAGGHFDKLRLHLEAQFYTTALTRKRDEKVADRDFRMERAVLWLIGVEIVLSVIFGIYGIREGNQQAATLSHLEDSASATAAILKSTLTVTQQFGDPCATSKKSSVGISQTGSSVIVHAAGGIWVCSIMVIGGGDESVSLVTGKGDKCTTETASLIGGTTAANGMSLVLHGGFVAGSGGGAIAIAPSMKSDLCLMQVGNARIAGTLSYAITDY